MNKIIVSMLAYNSEMFIKYALDSIYDFADKIIIVEGAYGLQRAYGKHSTDNTINLIKSYPDANNKIILLYKNGLEHEHRNEVLKFCEPGNWFFTVHTDEIYKKDHLQYLKEVLLNDKEIDVFKIPWFEFYYNFHLGIDNTYSPSRIYRVREGCRFIRKDSLATKDGKSYLDMNLKFLDRNNILMCHYAYINNVREKIRLYGKRGKRWYKEVFIKFTPEKADEIYKKNKEITGGYGIHLNGEPLLLTEFKGEHPEIMKDHPLAKRDLIEEFKKGYVEPFNEPKGLNKLWLNAKLWYYNKIQAYK